MTSTKFPEQQWTWRAHRIMRSSLDAHGPILLHKPGSNDCIHKKYKRSQMRWLGHLNRMPLWWDYPICRPGKTQDYVSQLVGNISGFPQKSWTNLPGRGQVWPSLLSLPPQWDRRMKKLVWFCHLINKPITVRCCTYASAWLTPLWY